MMDKRFTKVIRQPGAVTLITIVPRRRWRDRLVGGLLIVGALWIGMLALLGASYLDCQHARLAPDLGYCRMFAGAR